jgi:bacterioferritin
LRQLNAVLTNELTAINQYFLHSRMFRQWGLARLAEHEHHESIDEMKHADKLIERILFPEGLPNLQDLHKLLIGESAKEALECDLKLEMASQPGASRSRSRIARPSGDYVSRELFEDILESEESTSTTSRRSSSSSARSASRTGCQSQMGDGSSPS